MRSAYRSTATPDTNTAARHAEVARRYAWTALKRHGTIPKAKLLTLIRLRELERLFRRRYGYHLPNDDAGRDDLIIAAHHIANLRGESERHIMAWASVWCPWMPQTEAETLAKEIAAGPKRFRADKLGWRLRLTDAERTQLRITTIAAVDVSPAELAERKRRQNRERKARQRARQRLGRLESISRTQRWAAAGISRATWYRRRSKGETVRQKRSRSRVPYMLRDAIRLTPKPAPWKVLAWRQGLAVSEGGGRFTVSRNGRRG